MAFTRRTFGIWVLSLALVFSPAAAHAQPPMAVVGDRDSTASVAMAPVAGPSDPYKLAPGDAISVSVLGEADFSVANQQVRPDGTISMPLLGSVVAADRTVSQLAAILTDRLKAFLKWPTVIVLLDQPHTMYVTVVGAVAHPGLVSIAGRLPSLLEALSLAGGLTPDGDSHHVQLLSADGKSRINIDLAAYLAGRETLPHLDEGAVVVVDPIRAIDWSRFFEIGVTTVTFLLTLYSAFRR